MCLSAYAAPAFSVDNVVAQEKNVIRRRFGAASRMDSLLSRADEIPLSNEASLVYAESKALCDIESVRTIVTTTQVRLSGADPHSRPRSISNPTKRSLFSSNTSISSTTSNAREAL